MKKDISNVVVQCRYYSTISCRGQLCLNYLKKISQTWESSAEVLFYNKMSWFVSELPEKISQTREYCVGTILQQPAVVCV
jgi:hypothetical protein